MKVTLEPTSEFKEVMGLQCRVWQGHTEKGAELFALIPVIASPSHVSQAEFEAALISIERKSEKAMKAFDLEFVL